MADTAARNLAAMAAFAITAALYAATSTFAPSWPSPGHPSMAGLWWLDAIGRVPLGDNLSRAMAVAVFFAALTAAVTTAVIVRLGYLPIVATASAVILASTPAVWHYATSDVTGALASLLVAVAIAIALTRRVPVAVRGVIASSFFLAAVSLCPVRFAVAPPAWRDLSASAVALVREEWRLPATALIVAGLAAPIWGGARAPLPAIAATTVACALALFGRVAVLAPFAAVLMAHGLSHLPAITTRTRAAIAIALAVMTMAGRWQERHPPAWFLPAWRDALERTLPAGTVLATSNPAAAALHGALFANRPSGIELRLSTGATASGSFVLDDLRAEPPRTAVTLAFTNPLDAIGRLPRGTIVGLAITSPAVADNPALVNAALEIIGHPAVTSAAGVGAIGVTGMRDAGAARAEAASGGALSLWLGEPIGNTGIRLPTDLWIHVTSQGARIRLRGRDVIASDGWAAIALDRYGRVVATWGSDDTSGAWPLEVAGLNVWR